MADQSDPQRNLELAALADRIGLLMAGELDQYQAHHGVRPDCLLIAVHGPDIETAFDAADFEILCEAMGDVVADWIEDGLVTINDSEEPPAPRVQ